MEVVSLKLKKKILPHVSIVYLLFSKPFKNKNTSCDEEKSI